MNFDIFRSRVAQSAQAAAIAARQVSSLDEMAQTDEYVQSEGLNVSNKKKKNAGAGTPGSKKHDGVKTANQISPVVENLSNKFVDALSAAAKPANQTRNKGVQSHNVVRDTNRTSSVKAREPKLVSSVAALYEEKPYNKSLKQHLQSESRHRLERTHSGHQNKLNSLDDASAKPTGVVLGGRHTHILHQLNYDSDDDSSDEEEGNFPTHDSGDVELARNNSLSDELERELNGTLRDLDKVKKKDPYRFMTMTADLEERKSLIAHQSTSEKSNAEMAVKQLLSSQSTSTGLETRNAFNAGLLWVKNVASPQLQALSKHVATKVSESEIGSLATQHAEQLTSKPMIGPRHDKLNKTHESEEKIIMTTSATFLRDDDMAELERIKSMQSSSQMTVLVKSCLESLWGNPRLAFVAATFIFALFVYYYSRKRSVDDVL